MQQVSDNASTDSLEFVCSKNVYWLSEYINDVPIRL